MVSLVSSTCPSSFQLQWGLRCRRLSTPAKLRVRLCNSKNLNRGSCVVRAVDDGKGEKPRSWSNPQVSPEDSFSGWVEEGPGDSGEQKGNGGLVGAGLAGIFLAAGVAFASISLRSKRPAGVLQMKPLISHEEQLLSSNDENGKDGSAEEKSDMKLRSGDVVDPKSGALEERTTSLETAESAFDSPANHNLSDSTLSANSPSNNDLPAAPDFSPNPTFSQSKQSSSETNILESYDESNMKNIPSDLISDKEEVTVELHENISATSHIEDLSSHTTGLETFNSEYLDKSIISSELKNSVSSDEADIHLPSESSNFSSSLDLESNATVNVEAGSGDISEVNYFKNMQDTEHGEINKPLNEASAVFELGNEVDTISFGTISLVNVDHKEEFVVGKETISTPLGQGSLSRSGLPEAPSQSLVNQYINEPVSYQQVEKIISQTSSDFMVPNSSFSHAGIPAPSIVYSALQVPVGKILVPAVVDQVQGQAFSALQVLKVIEGDVQPGDICTRREYARWLVSASSALSRSTISKVYPAMYIENVTELAFDDITPEDSDFPYIQGLAEAGLISSKLTRADMNDVSVDELGTVLFSPESPLSRQDLVTWKMALERRQFSEVDKKAFYQHSGYIDVDKISPDAWPAIVADLSSGESGIISLAFGYTRLFQPKKPVTKAQAAVALSTGDAAEVVGEELTRIEAEVLAETAVAAHTDLVAEVERDLNASFEKELAVEREKINAIEKLAEEARVELEKLRMERDEENNSLIKDRASVESQMEFLSRLRNEVEEQLQNFASNKTEITIEKDRLNKLRMQAEIENKAIIQLQYDLEVERKALSMARVWAEDEAKRAREQAKVLEEARERWEIRGIKVIVDDELRESASDGVTFSDVGRQAPIEEIIASKPENLLQKFKSRSRILAEELKYRAETLVEKLKALALEVKGESPMIIERVIQKVLAVVSRMKVCLQEASVKITEKNNVLISKADSSIQELKVNASAFGSDVKYGARKALEDCKENMEKITQKFKNA